MKHTILTLVFSFLLCSFFAQKKHWINYNGKKTQKNYASYYYTFTKNNNLYLLKKYNANTDNLVSIVNCLKKDTTTKDGQLITYYKNKKIHSTTQYKNGIKEGPHFTFSSQGDTIARGSFKNNIQVGQWFYFSDIDNSNCIASYSNGLIEGEKKCYYKNGQLSIKAIYKQGKKVDEIRYTKTGKKYTPASYIGGEKALMNFLAKNVNYPLEAIENNYEGKAIIEITINKDGKTIDIISMSPKTEKVHPILLKEAHRVISLIPNWSPGTSEGKEIISTLRIPVNFKIR